MKNEDEGSSRPTLTGVCLGAGLGMIFGAVLGSAATGLVLGAAAGLLRGDRSEDPVR